jgi:hypothetical protein
VLLLWLGIQPKKGVYVNIVRKKYIKGEIIIFRENSTGIKEKITPPLEELGEISGMRISKTTTAKSYSNDSEVRNIAREKEGGHSQTKLQIEYQTVQ